MSECNGCTGNCPLMNIDFMKKLVEEHGGSILDESGKIVPSVKSQMQAGKITPCKSCVKKVCDEIQGTFKE